MSGRNPPKIHYWYKGDKTTKCGRSHLGIPTSSDWDHVTCQHCLVPNRPFTVSPLGKA
jgi:hypothetical protein